MPVTPALRRLRQKDVFWVSLEVPASKSLSPKAISLSPPSHSQMQSRMEFLITSFQSHSCKWVAMCSCWKTSSQSSTASTPTFPFSPTTPRGLYHQRLSSLTFRIHVILCAYLSPVLRGCSGGGGCLLAIVLFCCSKSVIMKRGSLWLFFGCMLKCGSSCRGQLHCTHRLAGPHAQNIH